MQNHRRPADFECRIKCTVANFAKLSCSNQGNNHASPVAIELCRLDNHDEWNTVLMHPRIPVDIKLCHQSEEYSSAMDRVSELNSFHILTVDSTALDFARRS